MDDKGQETTFGGHVKALGEDKYQVLGTIHHAGSCELRVRVIWRNFSPLSSCRCGRICLQRDSWNVGDAGTVSRPIVAFNPPAGGWMVGTHQSETHRWPPDWVSNSKTMFRKVEKATLPPSRSPRLRYTCRTMEELMDGAWLQESSCPYQNCTSPPDDLPPLNPFWSPNSCDLKVHNGSLLQELFHGMHIHLVGDSTMHETSRPAEYPRACQYDDRVFDSGSAYPVRFSFAWAGGPDPCDNLGGIMSIIQGPGREHFMSRRRFFDSQLRAA